MTTEGDLLEAVRREPADDTVRLAYADFLDERGSEEDKDYALYIRNAIWLHNTPGCGHAKNFERAGGCRYCELADLDEWFSHNPVEGRPPRMWRPSNWFRVPGAPPLAFSAYWRRGFVYQVAATTINAVVRHAPHLFHEPIEIACVFNSRPYKIRRRCVYGWLSSRLNIIPPGLVLTDRCFVPPVLWNQNPRLRARFSSADEAVDALNSAILAYGRSRYEKILAKRGVTH